MSHILCTRLSTGSGHRNASLPEHLLTIHPPAAGGAQAAGTWVFIHPVMDHCAPYTTLIQHLQATPHCPTMATIDNPHLLRRPPHYPSLQAMAEDYARLIVEQTPGPYTLLGWSMGGVVAHHMAHWLTQQHRLVEHIHLIDAIACHAGQLRWSQWFLKPQRLAWLIPNLRGNDLATLPPKQRDRIIACGRHENQLLRAHHYQKIDTPCTLYKTTESPYWAFRTFTKMPDNGWEAYCADLRITYLDCHHFNLLSDPHCAALARAIAEMKSRQNQA